jgi:hypothetical protein
MEFSAEAYLFFNAWPSRTSLSIRPIQPWSTDLPPKGENKCCTVKDWNSLHATLERFYKSNDDRHRFFEALGKAHDAIAKVRLEFGLRVDMSCSYSQACDPLCQMGSRGSQETEEGTGKEAHKPIRRVSILTMRWGHTSHVLTEPYDRITERLSEEGYAEILEYMPTMHTEKSWGKVQLLHEHPFAKELRPVTDRGKQHCTQVLGTTPERALVIHSLGKHTGGDDRVGGVHDSVL